MTPVTANESIDPITHEDDERIKQTAQQARPGENPEEATLLRATSIAAIGLMRDAMLADDNATTARWSDLEQEADGSGRLTISHTVAYVSKNNDGRTRRHGLRPARTGSRNGTRTTPYSQQTLRFSSSTSATHVHPQASMELTAQTRPGPA